MRKLICIVLLLISIILVLFLAFFVINPEVKGGFITISAAIIGGTCTVSGIVASNNIERKKRNLHTRPILTIPVCRSTKNPSIYSSNENNRNIKILLHNSGEELFEIKKVVVHFNKQQGYALEHSGLIFVNSNEDFYISFSGIRYELVELKFVLSSIDNREYHWEAHFKNGIIEELVDNDRVKN